jgi:hypothetical protein
VALKSVTVSSTTVRPKVAPSPFSAAQVSRIYNGNPTTAGELRQASVGDGGQEAFDVYDSQGSHAVVRITNGITPSLESALFDFTIDGNKYFAFLQDSQVSFSEVNGQQILRLTGIVKLPFDAAGRVWDQSSLVGTKVQLEMPFGNSVGKAASAVFSITAPGH